MTKTTLCHRPRNPRRGERGSVLLLLLRLTTLSISNRIRLQISDCLVSTPESQVLFTNSESRRKGCREMYGGRGGSRARSEQSEEGAEREGRKDFPVGEQCMLLSFLS